MISWWSSQWRLKDIWWYFLGVHLRYPRCARTSRSQCDCRERTTTGRGSWLGNTSSRDTWILLTDTTISLHSSPVILMWITKWFFRKQFLVSTLDIFIVWNIFRVSCSKFHCDYEVNCETLSSSRTDPSFCYFRLKQIDIRVLLSSSSLDLSSTM